MKGIGSVQTENEKVGEVGMKSYQTWKRNKRSEIYGESITLTILYSSLDKEEIDELEKKMPKGTVVIEGIRTDGGRERWWNDNHGELARCKDCVWNSGKPDCPYCQLQSKPHEPDWFCADGERRE